MNAKLDDKPEASFDWATASRNSFIWAVCFLCINIIIALNGALAPIDDKRYFFTANIIVTPLTIIMFLISAVTRKIYERKGANQQHE